MERTLPPKLANALKTIAKQNLSKQLESPLQKVGKKFMKMAETQDVEMQEIPESPRTPVKKENPETVPGAPVKAKKQSVRRKLNMDRVDESLMHDPKTGKPWHKLTKKRKWMLEYKGEGDAEKAYLKWRKENKDAAGESDEASTPSTETPAKKQRKSALAQVTDKSLAPEGGISKRWSADKSRREHLDHLWKWGGDQLPVSGNQRVRTGKQKLVDGELVRPEDNEEAYRDLWFIYNMAHDLSDFVSHRWEAIRVLNKVFNNDELQTTVSKYRDLERKGLVDSL